LSSGWRRSLKGSTSPHTRCARRERSWPHDGRERRSRSKPSKVACPFTLHTFADTHTLSSRECGWRIAEGCDRDFLLAEGLQHLDWTGAPKDVAARNRRAFFLIRDRVRDEFMAQGLRYEATL